MAWDCSQYYDFIADRTPHWTTDILKDWFPTDDAWIGQIQSEDWGAFTGTEHVRDRMHMGAPDLSQGWTEFDTQSMLTNNGIGDATAEGGCLDNPCTPPEICVGWGLTRSTFGRWRTGFSTRPFCFDTVNTRALAKKQFGEIVAGLKDITKMVQADRHRYASLYFSDKVYICGDSLLTVDITASTFTGACTTMDLGGDAYLPESELTIGYLQRFYEPLQYEGYFKSKYVPAGMFKLITDPITSQQLTTGNPALTDKFRFTDFQKGGELFKYGMSAAVGNFGITWDGFPMRFNYDTNADIFRRIWPFINVAAGDTGGPTMGIKKTVNTHYTLAPYQMSQIWHPEAMKRYTVNLESVNPEMPFLVRDLAGKWNFIGGNRDRMFVVKDPVSGDSCTIDNKRGNQGAFWADFEDGMEMQRSELVRQILHLREPGCVVNKVPCTSAETYVAQDYGTCLDLCQEA